MSDDKKAKAAQAKEEQELITTQWREFSKTTAYKKFMEYIDIQKKTYEIMASGPMEVYKEVPTFDGKSDLQLDFEPEKYAYLLQRGVGCDIVKIYVEGYTVPSVENS